MNRIRPALFASVTLAVLLLGGCPTAPSDNSNSSANENGSTGNSNGSIDNSNSDVSTNENGSADNSNSGGTNENANSSSNENSNSSTNSNANENSGTPGPSIQAAWSGTLDCERTQALGSGSPGTPSSSTMPLAITFGSDNKPTSIVINGYSDVPNQTVTIRDVGETVTNNVSASGYSGTMQMTIASATFASDHCEIVVNITLAMTSISNSAATQSGTGQQTITAQTNGTGLDYSADSTYQVRLQVTSIQFDTTEHKTCTGTLAK